MRLLRTTPLLLGLALAIGCAWVPLSDDGEQVQAMANTEVTGCKRLGNTKVSVLKEILFVPRPQWAVQDELETLARNEGAKLGGNTVTALPSKLEGERDYAVYRCED